jgi:serine/threonine protein kinase
VPEKSTEIRKAVQKRVDLYKSKYPVLHLYDSNRTRAKIEKIDYHGKPAILKTFKLGYERFAEREAFVYETFSKDLEMIPPLLEKTQNTIIIPLYHDVLKDKSRAQYIQILKPYAAEILKAMRYFYDKGYALIGFYPGNILLTKDNKLKIIDFEFIYKYKIKPASFADAYDIKGIPTDFNGDLPRGSTHTYSNTWKPILEDIKDW